MVIELDGRVIAVAREMSEEQWQRRSEGLRRFKGLERLMGPLRAPYKI